MAVDYSKIWNQILKMMTSNIPSIPPSPGSNLAGTQRQGTNAKLQEEMTSNLMSGLSGFGASLRGRKNKKGKVEEAGLLDPGAVGANAGGAGRALSGAGGLVGGTAGAGLQIAGAILKIAQQIDNWSQAQVQSNFARFSSVSQEMAQIENRYNRQMQGIDITKAEAIAPSARKAADDDVNLRRALAPVEIAASTAQNKASSAWSRFARDYILGVSRIGSAVSGESGKDWGERKRAEQQKMDDNTPVTNFNWALDTRWINSYMIPNDFGGN